MHSIQFFIAVILFLFVIFHNATLFAYYISRTYSYIACESIEEDKLHEKCGDIFVHTNDISGPANSIRFNIQWEQWMCAIIEKYC